MRYLAACILMMVPGIAAAQVFITEVMYDLKEGSDSGREWIEVYNGSGSVVDLTKWKLVESGKNHKIAKVRGGFAPGTHAVIADNPAKFANDHPGYAGTLFDSAFSLSNDGETLVLLAPGGMVDEVRFATNDGGSGTGDSLQRIDLEARVFAPGIPTPGGPIPESGLQRTPQVPKGEGSDAAVVPVAAVPVQGERVRPAEVNLAAAARAGIPAGLCWGAVSLIALWGAGGIAYARRLREDEWEIIEES